MAVEGLGDYFVGEHARVYVAAGRRPTILASSTLLTLLVIPAIYIALREDGSELPTS